MAENDSEAGDLFEQYKTLLRSLAPADFKTLEAAMADFDYDIAEHCLVALLARLPD